MDINIIRVAMAFVFGWAAGYFTSVAADFFQEKEDESL